MSVEYTTRNLSAALDPVSVCFATFILRGDCSKECNQLTELNHKKLLEFLNKNKLDPRLLPEISNRCFGIEIDDKVFMNLENMIKQAFIHKNRLELTLHVLHHLYKNNVKFWLIKYFETPFTLQSDIDILPFSLVDYLEVLLFLHKHNCRFYRFRLLAHKLKILAKCRFFNTEVEIDIYPDVMWIQKRVASIAKDLTTYTFEEAHLNKSSDESVVPIPPRSLNFYIVATHAYSHLEIPLADALQLLNLSIRLREADYKAIIDLALKYGTVDAIYIAFLLSNSLAMRVYGHEVINSDRIKNICRNFALTCKSIERWLSNQRSVSFPIRIPYSIGVLKSSLNNALALIKLRYSINEILTSFLSHYLAFFANILG